MTDHIQIGDITPRMRYVGDGASVLFSFPFPVFQDADLAVYVDGTQQTLSSDYTVQNAGVSSGGTVTFSVAPASGAVVAVVRRLVIKRTTDFQESGEFRAKVINDELDFQTAALQQIQDDQARSVQLSTDDAHATLTLPTSGLRATKLLGFDASGNVEVTTLTKEQIEAGATGPAGPQGPTGPAGADGTDGIFATVASQAEAEAGTDNTKGMTPLRAAQAIAAQAVSGANPNLIINGGMTIAQRGTSATTGTSATFSVDRFSGFSTGSATGAWDIKQSTDVPDGQNFTHSLHADVTTADTSLSSTELYMLRYTFEGFDTHHLNFGASDAKTVTLSFWVKSPKTGTHCVAFKNGAQDRHYIVEYTVNTADTWEKKTITIAGDTSGAWGTFSAFQSMQIVWPLATGSDWNASADTWAAGDDYTTSNQVNVMDDAANNFYLTGVKFEVGDTATDFEFEDFSTTLNKCQRYYYKTFPYTTAPAQQAGPFGAVLFVVTAGSGNWNRFIIDNMPVMRASPTVVSYNPQNANSHAYNLSRANDSTSSSGYYTGTDRISRGVVAGSGWTLGDYCIQHFTLDAEL